MRLNNENFDIVLKQGTAANLAAATTFLREGEMAYTTDDAQLHVGDGDGNKLLVPVCPQGVVLAWGNGTPEGAVTAGVGSMYLRLDGGAGTVLYVKESGTGNTGWVAK